jgi:transcriptional regulator with XRE-family HTH domain
VETRKAAGLTQKAVAERLRRGDGRKVLPPYLNDLERGRRYPSVDALIKQLAKILNLRRMFFISMPTAGSGIRTAASSPRRKLAPVSVQILPPQPTETSTQRRTA